MRKAIPETIEPQLVLNEKTDLARIVPIRTETTLTRYPFHRIAKRGPVRIKQTAKNERGKTVTTWEVKHAPGPLAYKLDTIIINRRIDEMRNRGEIKQLFRVGSLRDICEELGVIVSGKTTNAIKEALRENAGALITAKIEYRGNDGTEREFEFTTTRYTVIFTGEKLPNEKRADAVYIELHPRYHEMLRHSKTRPLDYEYLKALPPSAQRLYELLSFAMFGTLKYDRANAQMLYSEFCQSAPLLRYEESKKMHTQMWKIHKPHIEAGYIKSVDFEETSDERGSIDWVIKYTPGCRARNEFKAFATRRIDAPIQTPRLLQSPTKDEQTAAPPISPEDAALIAQLVTLNITEAKARELVTTRREAAERELEAFPHRDRSTMKDPAAWLIRAIESGDYSQPAKVEEKRAKRAAEQAKKRREEAEQKYRGDYLETYLRPLRDSLRETNAEAFEYYGSRCARIDEYFSERPEEELVMWKLYDLELMAEECPDFGFLTFWQWLKNQHPEASAE